MSAVSGSSTARRLGERWPNDTNVLLVRGPVQLPSPMSSFGEFNYMLYEAYPPGRRFSPEAPYLVVWLHGQANMHVISPEDVAIMARRFNRRLVCMAPKNPGKHNGLEFFWALAFTKEQDRNGLGFLYGTLNYEVLSVLCSAIKQVADEANADRTILGGYSMGGFGALQLGGYRPDLFDAIFTIAGHGIGTLLSSDQGYKCPQPDGEVAFHRFLDTHASNLSKVPLLLAIHARSDKLSSYHDMEVLVEKVRYLSGEAQLVTVPEEYANADVNKSKTGHGYYQFALTRDTSDWALYAPISTVLASETCVYRKEIAALETDMAYARAEAQAAAQAEAQAVAEAKLKEDMRAKAEAEQAEKERKEEAEKKRKARLLGSRLDATMLKITGSEKKIDVVTLEEEEDNNEEVEKKRKEEAIKKRKMAAENRRNDEAKKWKNAEAAEETEETEELELKLYVEPPATSTEAEEAERQQSDEAKRQQMRERRKKLLEQRAVDSGATNGAPA